MKSTRHFQDTIKAYLDKRASEDGLFAVSYAKTTKNMDDCIIYILNEVEESGCNGFTDDEIYSMAVHYYDEDGIAAGKPLSCHVVVNHTVELTAEEKEEARREAMKIATSEAYAKMKHTKGKNRKTEVSNSQTLF